MQKKGLGRGLGSLLEGADDPKVPPGQAVQMLALDRIQANPDQPRKDFDPASLEELAASIREQGILQPILVRERGGGFFQIVAGERRYRAATLAGLVEIPVLVRSLDDEHAQELALIENVQREDLNPVEEALAYRQLLDRFGLSQEVLAQRVGKSRSAVANSLRLLRLPEEVLAALRREDLSAGHARALLGMHEEADQRPLFREIVQEGLSVRDVEALVKKINEGQSLAEALVANRTGGEIVGAAPQAGRSGAGPGPSSPLAPLLGSAPAAQSPRGAVPAAGVGTREETAPANPRPVELWDLEERLIVAFGTRVTIKGDLDKGKIEIHYYSLADLERIHDLAAKPGG